jgi:hypothetical protein
MKNYKAGSQIDNREKAKKRTEGLNNNPAAPTAVPQLKVKIVVTIQLTSDLPDSGVKSAHIHLYTARFFLVLEQIRGNLNSCQ